MDTSPLNPEAVVAGMRTCGDGPLRNVAERMLRNELPEGPAMDTPPLNPEAVVAGMRTCGDGPLRDAVTAMIRNELPEGPTMGAPDPSAADKNPFVTVNHGPLLDVMRRAMMMTENWPPVSAAAGGAELEASLDDSDDSDDYDST